MRISNSSRGYHYNHYVPEWYQKKFLRPGQTKYWHLDIKPEVCTNGKATWTRKELLHWSPVSCFAQDDLYAVKWGNIESTGVEQFFFGQIDNEGKDAVDCGQERVMFGSNFPVDSLVVSFNRVVRGTMAALHPFGEGAVRQVIGPNALPIYRIEAPEQVRSASAGEQFA